MSEESAKTKANELTTIITRVERLRINTEISKLQNEILKEALDIKNKTGMFVATKQCDILDKLKERIDRLPDP